MCQSETKPSGHSLNPLRSSGDAHHRASSLLPGLKDPVPLLFYEEFLPKPTSIPRVDLGQHTQVTGLPAKPFLRPKTQRKTTERLPSQTFFPPWQLANPSLCFSSKLDKIAAENPSCSPPPRAMQSQGRNGFMGTSCCLASDFPPKYGIGKRLEGYGCDLHTALLSSAISLKNQPFNCGHISTSPNLLIIDSW